MSLDTITQEKVDSYIQENLLNSEVYDSATAERQLKAFNQSRTTLSDFIKTDKITIRDVAEQVVFLFMIDHTIQRAELGVTFVTVDGIQMTINDRDRVLAPSIMRRHNIRTTTPARVGRYHTDLHHTFRYGIGGD